MRNGGKLTKCLIAATSLNGFVTRIAQLRHILINRQVAKAISSNRAFVTASSSSSFSSTNKGGETNENALNIRFEFGLPLIEVPLPSRNEPCQFTMRPLSDTIGNLCDSIKMEDRGVDYVAIYGKNGTKLATSTSIEHLLQFQSFRLRLNDKLFEVTVPKSIETHLDSDKIRQLDDLRATVASLHAALCVDEYKLNRERKLIEQLEEAETELKPLHEKKLRIERECESHTDRVMWAGFAAMGVQTGLFARLTWWEYSWDIMEPVTYFATYSTVVATFGYYLYTRQSFEYPSARERVYTKQFYRRAQKAGFDIENYNRLAEKVEHLQQQLKKLRDPLFQHLPVSYLTKLE